jgi:hypothetical protein
LARWRAAVIAVSVGVDEQVAEGQEGGGDGVVFFIPSFWEEL